MRYQTTLDLVRFARALADAGDAHFDAASLLSFAEALLEEIGTAGPPHLHAVHEEAPGAISGPPIPPLSRRLGRPARS